MCSATVSTQDTVGRLARQSGQTSDVWIAIHHRTGKKDNSLWNITVPPINLAAMSHVESQSGDWMLSRLDFQNESHQVTLHVPALYFDACTEF